MLKPTPKQLFNGAPMQNSQEEFKELLSARLKVMDKNTAMLIRAMYPKSEVAKAANERIGQQSRPAEASMSETYVNIDSASQQVQAAYDEQVTQREVA